jgi:serine/threonine-protein kinase
MLTGRLPFRGDSPMHVAIQQVQAQPPAPASLVDGLPLELNDLVLRLLAKEPEQRPASAETVARELKTIAKALAVDMTQLSGFARAVPEPVPAPASRPAPKKEAPAAPPRVARTPTPPPAETVEAPSVITGSRPAVPPPSSEATAVERPGARPAPMARPQAARPQARPQAAAPRSPPTTDVIPVQAAPDTDELASVRSRSFLKPLMGVGLAAVLMGVAVGVVVNKGDSGPAVPEVPAVSAPKDPVAAPGSKPQPTSLDPQPKVETPPVQTETLPTQPVAAKVEDTGSQKTEPDSAQEDATSEEKPRSPGEPGILRLQSPCWGYVYIDNELKGRAPPMKPTISLPAGKHKLELRGNPNAADYAADIVIRPAQTTKHVVPCPRPVQ